MIPVTVEIRDKIEWVDTMTRLINTVSSVFVDKPEEMNKLCEIIDENRQSAIKDIVNELQATDSR